MDDFESRLREFRPRRPASIPDARLALLRGPIWVAIAAGMAAAMLVMTWMHPPAPPQRRDAKRVTTMTLGALTTIAVERPEEFDAALTQLSSVSLPDVTRPGGALQQLARGF